MVRGTMGTLGVLLAASVASRALAAPCPAAVAAAVASGWTAYRADSIDVAAHRFQQAEATCPRNLDARVGLGYVALRLGNDAQADSLFCVVAARDPGYADAWTGMALAAERQDLRFDAVHAAQRALALAPHDPNARAVLARLVPGADRPRPRRERPADLQVAARTFRDRFDVPGYPRWTPFYVRGVNLGVTLPGKFPAEFPADSIVYAGWLDTLAAMHANAVRLYTILPPAFYRALAAWNATHPARALWLIHGVWAELPPGYDFEDTAWKASFRDEMRRVVDVIHGAADLPLRPGHAAGRYDADVSAWTLAFIVGREWEPFAVNEFNIAHPALESYRGSFLEAGPAPAADRWMAEQCDFMLGYEVDAYNAIRPIAYTNWPTLDPLNHPTEASAAEQRLLRLNMGRPAGLVSTLEYDNDAVTLDAALVHPTAANPAGWFASFHAYPYYPDFMLYDPGYAQARSSLGRSNYFGYLSDLKHHFAGMPLLIAEYGVPSSRGAAHDQPQGWTHGGHDERAMARIDVRMTREIRESGCAGGVLFAWIDEWFKKNWIVIDLEIPLDRTRLWHNAMDAEQNYGILAMDAGDAKTTPALGGDPARWRTSPPLAATAAGSGAASPSALHARSDEGYIYLGLDFAGLRGAPFPWDSTGIMLALATCASDSGQHALPQGLARSEVGFEFLLDLRGPAGGRLLVTPDYNPYIALRAEDQGDDRGCFYQRPALPRRRDDGRFDSLFVITNRARIGRDGTFYPMHGVDRGRLRYGTQSQSTLSDWYYDAAAGVLEVRIPWGMLNVTDPSSASVLFDTAGEGEFGTARTPGLRIAALTYRKGASPEVLSALPPLGAGRQWAAADLPAWTWTTWEVPRYHARLKPVYGGMRALWASWADSTAALSSKEP